MFAGFGEVWSASSSGLVELSPTTAKARIVLHQPADDIALSPSFVYVLSAHKKQVLEIDPHSLDVVRRWSVPSDSGAIAVGGNALYAAYGGRTASVERIDLGSGAVTRSALPGSVGIASDQAIAYGAGRVWLIDGSSLYSLDPVHASVPRSRGLVAKSIWFGDGALWAASSDPDGGVERVDPATLKVTASLPADSYQVGFSPNMVLLSEAAGPAAVDPQSGRVLASLPSAEVLSNGAAGIAMVGQQVWTTYGDKKTLQRIAVSSRLSKETSG